MHTITAAPNADSDLPVLEATARERGVFIEDAHLWGADWRTTLLQRLDNQAFCKQEERRAKERSARLAGRNPVLRGDAITNARAQSAMLGGAR